LVYGAPKETVEKIEKQQGFLEKEKEKFIKIMDNGKADFEVDVQNLEMEATNFKKLVDGDNYEEIANQARSIKKRVDAAIEKAKLINNRESLVQANDDPSDYSNIT
jgi:hypothetical protein